jgi:DNA-binding MarR family transcriptional regulator
MTATPTAEELATIARLRAALRRFHAATDEITRQHGLTARRYDLLAMLHGSDSGGCTATELAKLLQLNRNSTTELITRAENANLVTRAAATDDARVKLVRPTTEGTRRFFAALTDLAPERRRLLRILDDVATETSLLIEWDERSAGGSRSRARSS